MNKLLILTVTCAVLFITGCSDASGARKTLESGGYTNITTQGYDLFACGEDDFYSTKFKAKNPAGKYTKGVVCSGMFFKGGTIRH